MRVFGEESDENGTVMTDSGCSQEAQDALIPLILVRNSNRF